MSKEIEGMVEHGIWQNAPFTYDYLSDNLKEKFFEDMRAALLWLSDNVSDEMLRAFSDKWTSSRGDARAAIAAALRAAGGGG